jgi:hypothetical protein
LISFVAGHLYWKEKDRVSFEIQMKTVIDIPLIISVLQRKKFESLQKEDNPDLVQMCKKINFENLNKEIVCIADSDEIANYLFD